MVLLQLFSLVFVDRTLIEAAHNLRCGRLRTVFEIVVPAARVGLVIAALFCFILTFGDFVSPLYLGGGDPPTLSILITDTTKSGQQWPRAAVIALTMIATLLAVAFAAVTLRLQGARTMNDLNRSRLVDWALRLYIVLSFAFIFAPIAASFVFSLNVDRFPSLPLGGFSTIWYEAVYADPLVWEGLRNTLIVGVDRLGARHCDRLRRSLYRLPLQILRQVALSGTGAAAADHSGGHPRPRDAGFPVECQSVG